jgi:serine/threonine protein kinase
MSDNQVGSFNSEFEKHEETGAGTGVFGTVTKMFKVFAKSVGRFFTMNMTCKNVMPDNEIVRQAEYLNNECRTMRRMANTPFVLNYHASYQDSSYLYLVTEYAENGSLRDYLKRKDNGLNDIGKKLLSAEIVLAVESFHKANLTHGRLSLDNVFVGADGHIRLGGSGLASRIMSTDASIVYHPSKPLMIREKKVAEDYYAIGLMMYEVLCGGSLLLEGGDLDFTTNVHPEVKYKYYSS